MNSVFDFIGNIRNELFGVLKFKTAMLKIDEAESSGSTTLDLEECYLTADDLKKIIPHIQRIPGLKKLKLSHNNLETLPEELGALTGLQELRVTNNGLRALPESIGQLRNLEILNVENNKLAALPQGIGGLVALKEFLVSHNALETLPEEIGNLASLERLCLLENNLEQLPPEIGDLQALSEANFRFNRLLEVPETIGKLSPSLTFLHLSENRLSALPESLGDLFNLQTLSLEGNPLSDIPETVFHGLNNDLQLSVSYNSLPDVVLGRLGETFYNLNSRLPFTWDTRATLDAIYGSQSNTFEAIKRLDLGSFPIRQNSCSTQDILKEFLSKVPVHSLYAKEIYIPAAKILLDTLLNPNIPIEERQNTMQKIATSLGNCTTPVRNFLTQVIVGAYADQKGDIPQVIANIITAKAIENEIITKLGFGQTGPEGIEKIQGLLNSVFMKGAENKRQNKVKIQGDRNYIPSGSVHPDIGFELVTEAEAQEFAKMCCKTDTNGQLVKTPDDKYQLAPEKITAIAERYFKALNLLSPRERAIDNYAREIQNLLVHQELAWRIDDDEVLQLLQIGVQKQELREVLMNVADDDIDTTAAMFLRKKAAEVIAVGQKYAPTQDPDLSSMATALNQGQGSQAGDLSNHPRASNTRTRPPNAMGGAGFHGMR